MQRDGFEFVSVPGKKPKEKKERKKERKADEICQKERKKEYEREREGEEEQVCKTDREREREREREKVCAKEEIKTEGGRMPKSNNAKNKTTDGMYFSVQSLKRERQMTSVGALFFFFFFFFFFLDFISYFVFCFVFCFVLFRLFLLLLFISIIIIKIHTHFISCRYLLCACSSMCEVGAVGRVSIFLYSKPPPQKKKKKKKEEIDKIRMK